MPDPLQWLSLNAPEPYGGAQAFAPVVPDDRHYFTRREIRRRAIEDDVTRRQAQQLQLEALQEARRKEQEAVNALPFISALDPYADDYQQQRARVVQQVPSALLNPGLRDTLQGYDYTNRATSQPDRHQVDAILNDYPELQDDFENEAATAGQATAIKNLRWKARDRGLEKRLGEYGFDFSDPKAKETLNNLRHPDKPYLDPVRVESWVKKNGTKGLETASPDARIKLYGSMAKLQAALADPLTPESIKPLLTEQFAEMQNRLAGVAGSSAFPAGAPSAYGETAPKGINDTLPASDKWQKAKDEIANAFAQEANGDPAKIQELLRDPALRSQVLKKRKLTGARAFGQDRWGSDSVTYDEVLENMLKDNGQLQQMNVDPLKVRGETEVNKATGKPRVTIKSITPLPD